METENFEDLKPNPKNPRKISQHDFESLKNSIQKFGDLSSVIRNQRTGHLVGGHMRRNAFERMGGEKRVVITHRFDTPNRQGTVAIGHIEHEGEMYGYRVVDWDEATETSASISANNISGEWDTDLLSQNMYDISQFENGDDLLAITGFDEDEIAKLLNDSGAIDLEEDKPKNDDGMQRISAKFTDEQMLTIDEAVMLMKRNKTLSDGVNSDLTANAIYYICRSYLETSMSQNNAPTQEITPQETPAQEATISEASSPETPASEPFSAPTTEYSTTFIAPSQDPQTDLTSIPS